MSGFLVCIECILEDENIGSIGLGHVDVGDDEAIPMSIVRLAYRSLVVCTVESM